VVGSTSRIGAIADADAREVDDCAERSRGPGVYCGP
jgi:hypothetical protein